MITRQFWLVVLGAICLGSIDHPVQAAPPGVAEIESVVAPLMKKHKVPGLSIAVVNNYQLDWTAGFGRRATALDEQVDPHTLFQAASISKPVTALAALKLVQDGKLNLDDDVNQKLTAWHVPASALLDDRPITLRKLLSHTAGLSVHGFPGYELGKPLPTILQVLAGEKPANTEAVVVQFKPGYMYSYSGGGFSVVQLLLTEVTHQPFAAFMHEQVLNPLGMNESTFDLPLSKEKASLTAYGYRANGDVVAGNYHVYPEMAAAGLWTTPADLCQVLIEVAKSAAKGQGKLVSQATAKEMLTVQKGSYALGLAVEGEGDGRSFSHGGGNDGFRCHLIGFPSTGRGVAIMTNSDSGGAIFAKTLDAIAKAYDWPTPVFRY
ncbi:MAG TPA: serine hydrolase domain-containing protein [Pirellulales bacterium]|jgi:CubicO group peptidase (beta-lactamase class C family)